MGVDVRVSGAAQIRDLAKQFKAAGQEGLGREMARALTKAVDPLGKAIDAEARKVAPSGYVGVLTRSLKHRRSVRASRDQASVRLTTTAKGKTENRDLPALNAGRLRHPVFGRRRKPWTVTSIPAGFYDRGTEQAADLAEKQLLAVIDEFAQRLGGE